MDQAKRDEIAKRLTEKGALQPCPRCGHRQFTVIEGYFNPTLQDNLSGIVLGGKSIPCAVVGCNNCGYLAQHALGALGLLPADGEGAENESK